MKNNRIYHLLDKYFEGHTTLEEERYLENYFSTEEDIEDDLRPLKAQFELFRKVKDFEFDSSGLESKILHGIEDYEKEQEPPARKLALWRIPVAASLIAFLAISAFFVFRAQNNTLKDTYSDPRLAYLETQKALLLISQKMNKGMEPLANISKINTGSDQLKKLQKIDESMGMLNLVSFINQSSNMKK
jgi:hypothetical protein